MTTPTPTKEKSIRAIIVDNIFPINRLEINNGFTYDEIIELSRRGVKVHVVSQQIAKEANLNEIITWGIPRGLSTGSRIKRASLGLVGLLTNNKAVKSEYDDAQIVDRFRVSIASKIVSHSIDLVHAQWPYPQGIAAALACEALRKPLIVSTRGGDLNVVAELAYGHRVNKRKDLLIKRALSVADHIIVPSRFMEDHALEAGFNKEKIALIPNGVDTTHFRPELSPALVRESYDIKKRPMILSMINGLHRPVKGLEYLLKAAQKVKMAFEDIIFVIGGRGLTGKIVTMTHDLGIQHNVLFIGPIPRVQVPLYYAASDIVAIPSLAEAQCMVSIESMATSTPVVASNVGGIPEAVEHGKNGLLVPARDPEALAEQLGNLLENPRLRNKMGTAGRETVTKNYDINDQIPKILKLYEQLVGR